MTVDVITGLYHKHAPALREVRREQRRLYAVRGDTRLERFAVYRWWSAALGALGLPAHYRRRLKPQLDDIEAEITYLLVRELTRPTVVEIAPDRGWSTTWLLAALRDNAGGGGGGGGAISIPTTSSITAREACPGRWRPGAGPSSGVT
ncbi:MAG TPA: hypothetical protein VF978_07920 [Gemmatimonadales bacterium]